MTFPGGEFAATHEGKLEASCGGDNERRRIFREPLWDQRQTFVLQTIRRYSSVVDSVLDLGCNNCDTVMPLLRMSLLSRVCGVEIDARTLNSAMRKLEMPEYQRTMLKHTAERPLRLELYQGSFYQYDARLQGVDAITLIEVIEHQDPEWLAMLPEVLFSWYSPKVVVVSTPNAEFNVHFPDWSPGQVRDPDHRFEWTRQEFENWCHEQCKQYGYEVRFTGVGEPPQWSETPDTGYATQCAVFEHPERIRSKALKWPITYPDLSESLGELQLCGVGEFPCMEGDSVEPSMNTVLEQLARISEHRDTSSMRTATLEELWDQPTIRTMFRYYGYFRAFLEQARPQYPQVDITVDADTQDWEVASSFKPGGRVSVHPQDIENLGEMLSSMTVDDPDDPPPQAQARHTLIMSSLLSRTHELLNKLLPPIDSNSRASRSLSAGANMLLTAKQEAAAIMQAAVKRISHACKQLLLGLIDYNDLTDEHVSMLYTQVVKEFFHTIDLFEGNGIDVNDIKTFPDNLRLALETVFEQANSPDDDAEDVSGEEINNLIAQLVRGLQEKHRAFVNGGGSGSSSSSGTGDVAAAIVASPTTVFPPTTPTVASGSDTVRSHANGVERKRTMSKSGSVFESPQRSTTNGKKTVSKLYLQIHDEVKRTKFPPGAPMDIETIRQLFVEKFHYMPPPNPSDFPKLYIRDIDSQVFYELEDMDEIEDGSLLKLQPVERPPSASADRRNGRTGSQEVRKAMPKYQIEARLQQVRAMKQDLAAFKSEVNDFRTAFTAQLDKTQAQIMEATAASPATLNRSVITNTKAELERASKSLSERLSDLFAVVEQMRMDMIQRSAVPSTARLEFVVAETKVLMQIAEKSGAQLSSVTPTWKQTWEAELKGVVAEQQFLKDTEALLDDSTERLQQIDALSTQLRRVADLAVSNPSAIQPRRRRMFTPVEPEEGFDGYNTVLQELVEAVDVDSTRRMTALKRAEKIRSWEKENYSSGDELAWEIRKAAKDQRFKLKSVGGVAEIERQRQERDAEIRRQLAAASGRRPSSASS
ncbi:hypothetical protein RI367_000894 [Sorochytrium milnesiophthora]